MVDIAYRLLGMLVQVRYGVGFLLAALNTLFVLALLRVVLDAPTAANLLSLVVPPLILGLAAYLLAQLPPGVVFRRAAGAAGDAAAAAVLPRGCRASARFRVGDGWEWRLLAPCSVALGGGGAVELRVPTPPGRRPTRPRRVSARRAVPSDMRWSGGPRMPLSAADPALIQRLVRERQEHDLAPSGPVRLALPRAALCSVVAGWQYAGWRRLPALCLVCREDSGAEQPAYLAVDSPAIRNALAAQLS